MQIRFPGLYLVKYQDLDSDITNLVSDIPGFVRSYQSGIISIEELNKAKIAEELVKSIYFVSSSFSYKFPDKEVKLPIFGKVNLNARIENFCKEVKQETMFLNENLCLPWDRVGIKDSEFEELGKNMFFKRTEMAVEEYLFRQGRMLGKLLEFYNSMKN